MDDYMDSSKQAHTGQVLGKTGRSKLGRYWEKQEGTGLPWSSHGIRKALGHRKQNIFLKSP